MPNKSFIPNSSARRLPAGDVAVRERPIENSRPPSPHVTDLEGKFMAIAATNDTDVNIRVFDDAEQRAMLVNIVDVPPLCNFILPAILRTGPLAIGRASCRERVCLGV